MQKGWHWNFESGGKHQRLVAPDGAKMTVPSHDVIAKGTLSDIKKWAEEHGSFS